MKLPCGCGKRVASGQWSWDSLLLLIASLTVIAAWMCALVAQLWFWAIGCVAAEVVVRLANHEHDARRPW